MTSGARADVDIRKLRIGDDLGGQRLLVLGDRLGIVDPHQHRVGVDVLAARDGHLSDAAVDPRGDVEARRVHLALHQQRLAPHQIIDRQGGDRGDDHGDDDGRNAIGAVARGFGASGGWLGAGGARHRSCGRSFRSSLGHCHVHSKFPSLDCRTASAPRCQGRSTGGPDLNAAFELLRLRTR